MKSKRMADNGWYRLAKWQHVAAGLVERGSFLENISLNRLEIRYLAVSLQHQYPPSLLTMLKSAGCFIFELMRISYTKKCALPQELVALLKSRGLTIRDEQKAINYLTNIGYFRLSAYLYPFLV